MAIDVLPLKSRLAERSGDVYVRLGQARLNGDSGTLKFVQIAPTSMTVWKSAEIIGLVDPSTDSIRVRLERADGKQYYIEPSDGTLNEVLDQVSWASEFSPPYMLGSLDLWTTKTLTIVVHLIRTSADPDPRITEINVLLDNPTWEGAVAQAIRDVGKFIAAIDPILIHRETLTGSRSQWKIGKPHSEHGYVLTDLVQVTVDGVHKSAQVSNGIVSLVGPPAMAGQDIEIAVKFKPSTSVRRVDEIRILHETPAWVMRNLAIEGGLVGVIPDVIIGGFEIKERSAELRITVQGVAHRVADALAMRIALQQGFADGITVTFPGGRCVFGQLDALVEVIDEGEFNLPMAQGVVILPLSEFVFAKLFRKQRADAESVAADPSLTLGQFLQTRMRYEFPVGDYSFSFNETDGFTNESPNA